jgi:DNA-directed RNA polymerase specialized sigma24 family protein
MPADSSTLFWLDRLRSSDPHAAQALWQRLASRLLSVARAELRGASRRVADEEDVVVQAFAAFLKAVEQGRLPRLDDRDNLWAVLFIFVERAAVSQRRRLTRQKRGDGLVRGDSALPGEPADEEPGALELALVRDQLGHLLAALDDDELRQIVLLRLQGHSNAEIAGRLGWAVPTIERRLRLIRQTWETLWPDEEVDEPPA